MAKNIKVSYDFNGLKVQGLADGTVSTDAVNKGQLDAQNTTLTNYIDDKILGLGERVGTLDPSSGLPTTGSGDGGSIDKNDYWTFECDGTILGVEVHKYERLIAGTSNPDTTTNTAMNTDWVIEHYPHESDKLYAINNLSLPSDTAVTVTHSLGKKYPGITLVDDATGEVIDLKIKPIDAVSLELTNETASTVTVSGEIRL